MSIALPSVPGPGTLDRLSTTLYRRPQLVLALLLALPVAWLGGLYLTSLVTLLVNGFFRVDDFTGQIVHEWTLASYVQVFTPANLSVILRTVVMAACVTVAATLLAFPLAYYIARYAKGRLRAFLYLAVLLPLWSSYLVRVYAWKLILAKEGVLTWSFEKLGGTGAIDALLEVPAIGGPSLGTSYIGVFLVLLYVWLPFMVLPIVVALERVPATLVEASSDLGARPGYSFRTVLWPLAFPGVVAGSIFTFSLSLGDYIIPNLVGPGRPFLGQVILTQQGTAGNLPLAAALSAVPIVIIAAYLYGARKMGALDAL